MICFLLFRSTLFSPEGPQLKQERMVASQQAKGSETNNKISQLQSNKESKKEAMESNVAYNADCRDTVFPLSRLVEHGACSIVGNLGHFAGSDARLVEYTRTATKKIQEIYDHTLV